MDDFEFPTRRYDREQPSYSDWPTAQTPPPPPPTPPRSRRKARVWPAVLASAVVAALVSTAISVPLARSAGGGDGGAQTGQTTALADPTASPADPNEPVVDASQPVPDQRENSPVENIAAELLPSVAKVDVGGPAGSGSGSAVVFRPDGYLVTNDHVVGDADRVRVTFSDGQPRDAEVVGTAQFTDLAVLKVDDTSLPAPEYAEETPRVGRLAVAIGSPFGLDATVTSGIVSALDRELATEEVQLSGLIQTDAAINPGNSGGALADDEGRVIGINTAIVSSSRTNSGVGFAIPSSIVVPIAERLIEDGEVVPAFLGINGGPVTPEVAERFDTTAGAVIVRVLEGTPADEAGMREGDIITRLDNTAIESMVQLSSQIQRRLPGETVTFGIVRDGEELELEVTLTERPAQP